ncbi:hypothetical protein QP315_00315 [Actinotignum timonense]|uniref:hypothetical protein n=2 Tax=Actinomycetaceae TaxID=2049 RepID=UPI002A7FD412|nr:hypothetical protein [Actinotignum timonense]MDK6905669.1 hypothetical protein [Actinotignum timonense]MDY5138821.1 hypothetical protein [Actinotignum timonense]
MAGELPEDDAVFNDLHDGLNSLTLSSKPSRSEAAAPPRSQPPLTTTGSGVHEGQSREVEKDRPWAPTEVGSGTGHVAISLAN